jgi:hypothetical protein
VSASKSKADSTTRRFVVLAGAIVAIGFVIGLGLTVSASSGGTTTTTTTVPSSTYRDKVATTLRETQAVAATFLRLEQRCASGTCIDNAAASALSAEGVIAGKINPVEFPTNSESAASAYADQLVTLQRTYLSIGGLTSKTAIAATLPGFKTAIQQLAAAARTVESLL